MTDAKKDLVGEDGVIRLTLERKELPVVLTDPKSGQELKCVLREMSGAQRDKYLNNLGARVRTDPAGKVTGIKNFDGLQSNLLGRCLYKIDDDGEEELFKESEIQQFPSRVQSALFMKAKDLNGLDEDAEDNAGND